ncbi:MAG: hypothetical protein OXB96_00680 [Candidatus Kaiserbacteria bacterium]|nr:hypothetical protein [Candidatus Kaiserbacteria bacterium]
MDVSTILSTEVIGLFILLAGFVVGLGAVTVIDMHGFLGRKSAYWSEATTRTHKVTKPLIWVGIALAIIGGTIFYWGEPFTGIPLVHSVVAVLLVLNGCFLSFSVSPFLLQREREGKAKELLPQSWQQKILASLLLSDIGWWGSLLLLVVYVVG